MPAGAVVNAGSSLRSCGTNTSAMLLISFQALRSHRGLIDFKSAPSGDRLGAGWGDARSLEVLVQPPLVEFHLLNVLGQLRGNLRGRDREIGLFELLRDRALVYHHQIVVLRTLGEGNVEGRALHLLCLLPQDGQLVVEPTLHPIDVPLAGLYTVSQPGDLLPVNLHLPVDPLNLGLFLADNHRDGLGLRLYCPLDLIEGTLYIWPRLRIGVQQRRQLRVCACEFEEGET